MFVYNCVVVVYCCTSGRGINNVEALPLVFLLFIFPPFLPVDLPEAEKLLLGLCCHGDRPSVWKTIYFECLSSGKHFLERVLVSVMVMLVT